MTTNKVTYCRDCTDLVISRGAYLLDFYDDVCNHYAKKGVPFVVLDTEKGRGRIEMTKFLELQGFIRTTETSENIIALKPTNHYFSPIKGHLFCFQPAEHFPDYVDDNDCEC